MLYILCILAILHTGIAQNIGDQCVEKHSNVIGRCTIANQCKSAQEDYLLNRVFPTYCSDNLQGGVPVICCRDGSNILQTANPTTFQNSKNKNDKRRVSERKCEEYSKSVIQSVGFIPLVPDPEAMTISAPKCHYSSIELIVGGESATQGEFPHMAAIGWVDLEENYAFHCGGSLIGSRFVLTAGHCVYKPRSDTTRYNEPTVVRLGEQNLDPSVRDGASPVDVPIKQIHKHPNYKSPSKYNDIALLELVTDVDFSTDIRPACLWSKPTFNGHKKAIATGWGVVDPRTKKTSSDLQKVSLSLFSNEDCNRHLAREDKRNWEQGVVSTQMCAGELRGGKDTCQGDSGSPLQVASQENQCIFHIMGLTSFGRSCGAPGKPAIYTRVSEYLDWIESIVWPGE